MILDQDISTTENLHAAIGKAIQCTSDDASSLAEPTTPTEHTRPIAIICSLTEIILLYIRDGEVSHTPNLMFFPQSLEYEVETVASDGVFALFDTFYCPTPHAEPRSFPGPYKNLPTEICQNIFSHACPSTRNSLESSCRFFHGISHDHGIRVGNCYFKKSSADHGSTAFIGESYTLTGRAWGRVTNTKNGATPQAGIYVTNTIVHLVPVEKRFGPVYSTFLFMPDSSIVKIPIPLIEVEELET